MLEGVQKFALKICLIIGVLTIKCPCIQQEALMDLKLAETI